MNGPCEPNEHSEHSPAAFFDLDKTIIAGSSTLALTRALYSHGLIGGRLLMRSAYARCVFKLGGADHRRMERMRTELSRLVRGWDAERVREIVEGAIQHSISPLVYAEAADLIAEHRAAGVDVYLVSSAGSDVVEPVAAMLGIEHVIATRMVVDGGRYTGEISFYAYAENKAEAIRQVAADRGYDLAASFGYSDSITDVPLLAAVGRPYAVNPDRQLRRVAVERGWPILDFARPGARPRAALTPRRTTTILTGVGALLATALFWSRRAERRDARQAARDQR